ncbi:hypothetical protein [Streptomyces europaeiscabiei]|uniref:hypothetical protein n=1 Tax=Streptomyces europaeiscabiei TaxID=146819 RepID=UPI0038F7825B
MPTPASRCHGGHGGVEAVAGEHPARGGDDPPPVALGGASIDPTLKAATPEAVSSVYWELHTTKRDQGEIVYRG